MDLFKHFVRCKYSARLNFFRLLIYKMTTSHYQSLAGTAYVEKRDVKPGSWTELGPHILIGTVILVFAAILRAPQLNELSLWFDDAWVALVSRMSAGQLAHVGMTSFGFDAILWIWFKLVGFSEISAKLIPFVAGCLAPVGVYALIAFAILARKYWTSNRKFVWKALLALTLTALFSFAAAIVFLPFVWPNLLMASARSIQVFSNYHIGLTMLYRGQDLPTSLPPWHYLPVWIGITTPVVILILFIASGIFLFRRNGISEALILWSTVLFPWILILVLHSPVYDAWRQFFFIYPPMVVLAGMAAAAAEPSADPRPGGTAASVTSS